MIAVLARTERSNGMNSVLRRMVFSTLLAHHNRNCRSETEPGRGPTVVLSEKSQKMRARRRDNTGVDSMNHTVTPSGSGQQPGGAPLRRPGLGGWIFPAITLVL